TTGELITMVLVALAGTTSAACNKYNPTAELDVEKLKNCIGATGAEVIFKGDLKYKDATFYWNSRLVSPMPAAVVRPDSDKQVQEIIKCASGKTTVSVRSGGHNYEGYWQGMKDGVVVDLRNMKNITVNKDTKKVVVGAGALLGNVIYKLWKEDKGVLPHGLQPTIGMGGMTLGGGFGLLSRNYGLLVDRVIEMKIVTPNGNLLTVTEKEEDLFFALRGAGGGNFGVVTEFTYSYIKMNHDVTVARYHWQTNSSNFTKVLRSVMNYYNSNPPNGTTHFLNLAPGGSITLGITQSDEVNQHECNRNKLESFIENTEPDVKIKTINFVDAFFFYAGLAGTEANMTLEDLKNTKPNDQQSYFKARSGFLKKSLDNSTMEALSKLMTEADGSTFVLIDLWGGKIKDTKGTAFNHRDMYASVQIGAGQQSDMKLVNDVYNLLKPKFGGGYQNYMDVDEKEDFMKVYYGDITKRLIDIKKKYDSNNTFKFELSIPLEV
ncbi:hypothetical protein L0F63_004219, partial [Massospora cicadina]